MRKTIHREQCDNTDEVRDLFQGAYDGLEILNAKITQMDGQILKQQREIKRLQQKPKKKRPPKKKVKKKGFVMKKVLVGLVVAVLLLAGISNAVEVWDINYDNVSNPESLLNLLRTRFQNLDSEWLLLTPTDTAPTGAKGKIYCTLTSPALKFHDGTSWVNIDTAGGVNLDGAYDFSTAGAGRTITAHDGSVVIQSSQTDTNAIFTLTHSGAMATDQVMLITKSGAGDMPCIEFENTGGGYDLEGTGALWYIGKDGLAFVTGLTINDSDLTFNEYGEKILNDTNNEVEFLGSEDFSIGLGSGASDEIDFTSDSAAVVIDFTTLDHLTGLNYLTFDETDGAATITIAADGDGDDLIISQTGSHNASVILTSAGNSTDAIKITASAGGFDIDGTIEASTITQTATGADDDLTISLAQAASIDASLILSSAGVGDDAVSIFTSNSAGDIDITSTDKIDINAADDIDIDGAAGIWITSADDQEGAITIETSDAAGQIQITSTDTTDDGIEVDSAGGIDIDAVDVITIDNSGSSKDISIDSDAGSLNLTGAEAAEDAVTITSGGGIDIDAVDDVDFTLTAGATAEDFTIQCSGAYDTTLSLKSSGTQANAIELITSAGGLDITVAGAAGSEDLDLLSNTGINITSTQASESAIVITTSDNAGQILIDSGDQTADGIDIDAAGGIDIDVTLEHFTIDLATASKDFKVDSALGAIYLEGGISGADAIKIVASGANGGFNLDAKIGGFDIDAVGGPFYVDTTGGGMDIDLDSAAGSIYLEAGQADAKAIWLYTNDVAGGIDIDTGTASLDIDVTGGDITIDNDGSTKNITLTSDGGSIYLQSDEASMTDALKFTAINSGITMVSAKEASSWTHTPDGADDDLTIAVGHTSDASLILQSAGSGTDALSLRTITNAGDIKIDSVDALDLNSGGVFTLDIAAATATIKITTDGTGNDDLTLQVDGDDDAHILLTSDGTSIDTISLLESGTGTGGGILIRADTGTATTSGAASITLLSDVGGIDIQATGVASKDAIRINAGTGGGINMDATEDIDIQVTSGTAGEDILITQSGTFDASILLTAAGTGTDAISLQAQGGIDIDSGTTSETVGQDIIITMTSDTDGEDIQITQVGAYNSSIVLTAAGTATDAISLQAAGGIDIDSSTTGSGTSSGQDINITMTSDTDGEDVLINQAGAFNSSITLTAAGTATDAIGLIATAGGIDITSNPPDGGDMDITLTTQTAGEDLNIVQVGAYNSSIVLTAAGTATDAISLQVDGTLGGIDIDTDDGPIMVAADGATNGDISIDAADDMQLIAAGDLLITVSGSTTLTSTGTVTLGAVNFYRNVKVVTTADALNAYESGMVITNTAASGTCTITLPGAAAGITYTIVDVSSTSGDDIVIQAAGGDTINSGSAGKKYTNKLIEGNDDAIPCFVTLVAQDGVNWAVISETGSTTLRWRNDNS